MNKLEVNKWLKGLIYKEDSAKRPASDKFLKGRAGQIAGNPKYDRHQRTLASMVYKFFDKKTDQE